MYTKSCRFIVISLFYIRSIPSFWSLMGVWKNNGDVPLYIIIITIINVDMLYTSLTRMFAY